MIYSELIKKAMNISFEAHKLDVNVKNKSKSNNK